MPDSHHYNYSKGQQQTKAHTII